MRIAFINSVTFGSTGGIICSLADLASAQGDDAYICVPDGRHHQERNEKNFIPIGGRLSEDLHILLGRFTGLQGMFSIIATHRFVAKLKAIDPDVIHLHNLHNSYVNLPILFRYLKKIRKKVIWTLHDCWALTGHCPHFDMIGCQKWKTECHNCPIYTKYPKSYVDSSCYLHKKKKKWFLGLHDLTIVTPSEWLSEQVKMSFLREYPIQVIHNGIDLSVFTPRKSDFRQKYGIGNQFMILGVSFDWNDKKGFDVFISLAQRLPDDYQIVLVGVNEKIEALLPKNVISIRRTHNREELAEIYTAADLLVNPTREDTYPTVNMEALACGTPVLTFRTGGSPEIIDESCGCVVDKNDVEGMLKEIIRIRQEKPYTREACLKKAETFNKDDRFYEYLSLYSKADMT